ncbi:unnamed protein product [Periconia digitata]|uniref:Peptidase M20 dimerisation domain-containing protein n=1 Tax=Periconia digitata TaxID=1303443 RepID=A0A9W4XV39_9PLEO|nr:unnamed protein product [Periconia digitata]
MRLHHLPLLALVLGATAKHNPAPILPDSLSNELLYLHRHLVEISSITGSELKVEHWLSSYLERQDFSVELQEVSKDRYNIYAYSGEKRATPVLVSSHIDTVPPFWPYYHNKTTDVIGGRGSVDAKGSVAAQIVAVQSLPQNIRENVALLYVVGEETGGDGMRAFSSWDERPEPAHKAVVFGEPTEGKLVCGHKGILGLTIHVQGKAAHSGYPWLGLSANDILSEALSELLKLRDGGLPSSKHYGNTTVNFGKIEGGVAANVVAETASAKLAVRLGGGTPKEVYDLIVKSLANVKAAAQEAGGDLTIERESEGYPPVNIDCDVEGFKRMTVNYGTDVPLLSGDHKRYLYGPGTIFVAHSDHEALEKKELEQAVRDYRTLIVAAVRDTAKAQEVEEL